MSLKNYNLTICQNSWLVLLRLAIGWHFLYEGLVKIFNPDWTPYGFLMDSKGMFAFIFHWMASTPKVLTVVDLLNEWGLTLIGLGLVLGIFTRLATWAGMLLLAFYYISHPPLISLNYALPSEGAYFIVDKVLIEFIALGVLSVFPTGKIIGFDRIIFKNK